MKINWLVRFQSKYFLVSIFSLFLILVGHVLELFGLDSNVFPSEKLSETFNTLLTILVVLGVVVDPTTEGLNDSYKALQYIEPKKDEVEIIE